jgi:hypothetical protein
LIGHVQITAGGGGRGLRKSGDRIDHLQKPTEFEEKETSQKEIKKRSSERTERGKERVK